LPKTEIYNGRMGIVSVHC